MLKLAGFVHLLNPFQRIFDAGLWVGRVEEVRINLVEAKARQAFVGRGNDIVPLLLTRIKSWGFCVDSKCFCGSDVSQGLFASLIYICSVEIFDPVRFKNGNEFLLNFDRIGRNEMRSEYDLD